MKLQQKNILFFIIMMLFNRNLPAQNSYLDSLEKNIANLPRPDTFRAKAINLFLSGSAQYPNSGKKWHYIEELISLGKRLHYNRGLINGYTSAGVFYSASSEYDKSFSYYDSAMTLLKFDSSKGGKRRTAYTDNNIANNYNQLGDYDKALRYYLACVKILEEINDEGLMNIYSNISDAYAHIDQPGKAEEYAEKSIKAAENSNDDEVLVYAYLNYCAELISRKEFKPALVYLDKAKPLVEKLHSPAYSNTYYTNLGIIQQEEGNNELAITNFRRGLNFAHGMPDDYQIADATEKLAYAFLQINNLAESKIYFDSLLLLARASGFKYFQKKALDGLSGWYKNNGDYKKAYGYLSEARMINDSLISEENKKQFNLLEARYHSEKNEKEIIHLQDDKKIQSLSLKHKSTLNYILFGSVAALLIAGFLVYRNIRNRNLLTKKETELQQQRISELEKDKQLVAVDSVLKGQEEERSRLARDLHDGLGGMLSGIKHSLNTMKGNMIMTENNVHSFERSIDMLDTSIREMRRVAHNLMPESLVKFGLDTALKDFCNDINSSGALKITYQSFGLGDKVIEQTILITIYRIVQELVNNIIKHAQARQAIVQITTDTNQVAITVEDDGKGFDPQQLNSGPGIGWINIRSRVDYLKGRIDIRSQPGEGTSVHIELSL
jgi:two-component system, NarL family, sensor kinase